MIVKTTFMVLSSRHNNCKINLIHFTCVSAICYNLHSTAAIYHYFARLMTLSLQWSHGQDVPGIYYLQQNVCITEPSPTKFTQPKSIFETRQSTCSSGCSYQDNIYVVLCAVYGIPGPWSCMMWLAWDHWLQQLNSTHCKAVNKTDTTTFIRTTVKLPRINWMHRGLPVSTTWIQCNWQAQHKATQNTSWQ